MAEEAVTYYPGDTVTLKVLVEHRANFVSLEAVLRGWGEQGSVKATLHAGRLRFAHPATGRSLEAEAPLPADLAAVLAALREYRAL